MILLNIRAAKQDEISSCLGASVTEQQWADIQNICNQQPTKREARLESLLANICIDAGACDDECNSVSQTLINEARYYLENP